MYIDFKKIFSVLLILFIGAVIGIGIVKSIESFKAPKQTVSVTGTGEVDAVTDQVNITVQIKSKTRDENKKDVAKLKSELIKLGIPESRITTSSFSQPIFFESPSESVDYVESSGKMMPPLRDITKTPTTTTNLTLVIDPIKDIDKIFSVVSASPNAQITNTYYSVKNRKTWETKAKEEALKDARNQVESIAKINKLRVGKLLTAEDGNNPRPYPMALKAIDSGSTTVGQELTQTINNTFYSEQSVKISASYIATYELY